MKKVSTESFPYEKYRSGKQVRFEMDESLSSHHSTISHSNINSSSEPPAKPFPSKLGKPQKQPPKPTPNGVSTNNPVPGHSFLKKAEILFNTSQAKALETSQSDASLGSGTFSTSFNLSQSGARLTDLCPEDKARIGELMKKLASEKEEKEKLRKALELREKEFEETIENIEKEKDEVLKESKDLQSQFKYSLNLLKSFQVKKESAEDDLYKEMNNKNNSKSQSLISQYSFNESLLQKDKSMHHGSDKENMSYENYPDREPPREEERVDKSLNLRHLSEFEVSEKPRTPISNLQRQERNFGEISKLKEDIEELTHNLRNVSFSPNKSFLSKSMINENEQLLRTQLPTQEERPPSPIKLVENFNPREQYRDSSTESKPVQQKPKMDKPPRAKQDNAINRFLKVPSHLEDGSSSEDEYDELGLAQKWLNHRKQKINGVYQQINEEKQRERQQERESREEIEEEKPQPKKMSKNSSASSVMRHLEERYSPIKNEPIKNETPTNRNMPVQQKINLFQTSPGFPDPTQSKSPVKLPPKGIFNSAGKMGGNSPQRMDSNSHRARSSSANKSSSEIAFDLNAMSPNDMLQLKKILDERLQIAQLREQAKELTQSAELKMKKIEEILHSPENQKYSTHKDHQRSGNSKSPALSNLLEEGHTARSENPFLMATRPFEPLDTLVRTMDTKKESKTTLVDSSIMKDFENLKSEYNTPQPLRLQSQGLNKDKIDDLTTRRNNPMEESTEYERLYEEKLKEFLKIRDRMLQSKGLKSARDINIEEILKSTLKAEAYKYQIMEDTARQTEFTSKMASPPTNFNSVMKSEMPTLSERDLLLSDQSRVRQSIQSLGLNSRLMTQESKDIKRSPILKPSPDQTTQSRNTPVTQTRHITFSTEQPVRIEKKIAIPTEDEDIGEEIIALNDDFYDDGLFAVLDDIEQNESLANYSSVPVTQKENKNVNIPQRKVVTRVPAEKEVPMKDSKSKIDEDFNSLFSSVKSMLSKDEQKDAEKDQKKKKDRVSKQLIHKFEKSDQILTTISSETEEGDGEDSIHVSEHKASNVTSPRSDVPRFAGSFRRDSKAETSSFVETDTSVLAINKKVDEMKRSQQKAKNAQRHQFTFRK